MFEIRYYESIVDLVSNAAHVSPASQLLSNVIDLFLAQQGVLTWQTIL